MIGGSVSLWQDHNGFMIVVPGHAVEGAQMIDQCEVTDALAGVNSGGEGGDQSTKSQSNSVFHETIPLIYKFLRGKDKRLKTTVYAVSG